MIALFMYANDETHVLNQETFRKHFFSSVVDIARSIQSWLRDSEIMWLYYYSTTESRPTFDPINNNMNMNEIDCEIARRLMHANKWTRNLKYEKYLQCAKDQKTVSSCTHLNSINWRHWQKIFVLLFFFITSIFLFLYTFIYSSESSLYLYVLSWEGWTDRKCSWKYKNNKKYWKRTTFNLHVRRESPQKNNHLVDIFIYFMRSMLIY